MLANIRIHANHVGRAEALLGTQTFPKLYETPVIGSDIARNSIGIPTPITMAIFLKSSALLKSVVIRKTVQIDLRKTTQIC